MLPDVPSGTVTFLFTDIEGSTRLLETLREQYETLLADHNRIFQSALSRWNGRAIETRGDSFFIAFPRAMDAVNYVMETQKSLHEYTGPTGVRLQVRMGLHTGEPTISQAVPISGFSTPDGKADVHPSYIGMDVHRAARIAAAGHGGQVLLSQTTRDLIYQDLPAGISIKNLGSHTLKDIRHPQPLYQLVFQGLPGEFPPLNTLAVQDEILPFEATLPESSADGSRNLIETYHTQLKRWRAQGKPILEKANLAILLAAPPELTIKADDLAWLMRSSLQQELQPGLWISRADTPGDAVEALDFLLREYPKPQIRLELVKALCTIQTEQSTFSLLYVVDSDDSHEVLSHAALEASRRGMLIDVFSRLTARSRGEESPAAIAVLIAVVDEFGSPAPEIPDFPLLQVSLGVIQRRWQHGHEAVVQRSLRSASGGTISLAILGSCIPLLALWIYPDDFEANRQFISIAAWVLSGAFVGMVWGGLQGFSSGVIISLVDLLWPGKHSSIRRFFFGGIAGLVFSLLMIFFASTGLLTPSAGPEGFVPVFLVYGYFQACALSWVFPVLGEHFSPIMRFRKSLQTTLFIGLIAPFFIFLVYYDQTLARLPIDWLYAALMPAGLAIANKK